MRIRVIQHVEFERPGRIAEWAALRGHELLLTRAWADPFPVHDGADLLVVLGGPMGACDEAQHTWLGEEKRHIAEAISRDCPVLGVCLGAQILATIIGGSVTRNAQPEIGWFPVSRTAAADGVSLFAEWPETAMVGHWHGDMLVLPPESTPVLSSAACPNQAFVFRDRVVGVQFHLEWTDALMRDMVAKCAEDVATPGKWVMLADDLLSGEREFGEACRQLLFGLLDGLIARAGDGCA